MGQCLCGAETTGDGQDPREELIILTILMLR